MPSKTFLILLPWLFGFINPIEEWKKPFPTQQMITRNKSQPAKPIISEEVSYEYEDIIVFSLKATVAAFHFNPKTFLEDQKRLERYFEPYALSQIEKTLFPATGHGIFDQNIIKSQACDAITRSPVIIEEKAPHFMRVRLPMILEDKRTLDVILSIQIQNSLRISDFSIEEAKE